jgi:hypothetical protein
MGERISGPKRQEAMGVSGKLNKEDPRNLQFHPTLLERSCAEGWFGPLCGML